MKQIRRILPVLFCAVFTLVFVLSFEIKANAANTSGTCGENATWTYNESEKTLTISGTGAISDYDYDVYGPWKDLDITKVVIGDGITTLGTWSFAAMDNLVTVEGCKDVTAINYSAFRDSGKLTTMPELKNVTTLANYVFCDAVNLTAVKGLEQVEVLEDSVFRDCKKLTELPAFSNVKKISANAFSGCTALAQLPEFKNVEEIGKSAFYNTAWLGAQGEWPAVNGILVVYSGSETVLSIPEGIRGLAEGAFSKVSVTELTFPATMENITANALNANKTIQKVKFSEGIKTIGSTAFYKCAALTEIQFPNSLTEIGRQAFYGCTGLKEVKIPKDVAAVGASAFSGCTSLAALTVAGDKTLLDDYAFQNCSALTVEKISCAKCGFGNSVFSGTSAANYYGKTGSTGAMYCVDADGKKMTIYKFGNNEDVITSTAISTLNGKELIASIETVVVEEGITELGTYSGSTLKDYANLKNVTLPESLKKIGSYAFYGTAISEIDIPSNVTAIDNNAFANMKNLTSLTLPETVTSLGNNLMSGSAVKDVTMKCDVTYTNYIFDECTSLETVTFENGKFGYSVLYEAPNVKELTIGAGVSEIGAGAFCEMNALETLVLEEGTYTEISEDAFVRCIKLKEVVIPETVLKIGKRAFRGCTALEKVTFYENLEEIGAYAFADCTSLKEAEIPLSVTKIGDYAFNGVVSDEEGKEDTFVAGDYFLIRGYVNTEAERYASKKYFNCTFEPLGGDISACIMTLSPTFFSYDGTAKEPAVTVKTPLSGTELVCGTMYTEPVYANNIEPGKNATATVNGIGSWYGSLTKKFEISGGEEPEKPVEPETPTISEEGMMYMYEVMMEMGLIDQNTTKFSQEQYEETIAMFAEFGYSKADAEYFMKQFGFWGDSGSEFETEDVYRIAGAGRIDTSYKVADALKEQLGVSKFDSIIIARNNDFADALTGSYLAVMKKAPIVLTKDNDETLTELCTYIKDNLTANGTVYILGGEDAVSANVEAKIEAVLGYEVVRLAGAGRAATNIMILNEAGVEAGSDVIIATNREAWDSLSASALKKPILIVSKNAVELNEDQKAIMEKTKGGKIYIVGGEKKVSPAFESELKEAYGEYNVKRIAGEGRLETSKMVAEEFFKNVKNVVVACSTVEYDGLCGGPLAAAMDAPLLLTRNGKIDYAEEYMQAVKPEVGYVLGGKAALENGTIGDIFNMGSIDNITEK